MQSFGVQQIIADSEYLQPLHDRQREMRQTFPRDSESDLVGLEANVKKLVGYFVEEDNVQVVSITGMGGVGKTTLARQVFNHEMVKRQFDRFAWVCVSQEFTRKNVWQGVLRNFSPREEENRILLMTESTLQYELFRLLETSKSLIVLDDIWKQEDWDRINPILPPKKGWKLLLTSRIESVGVGGDTYINFKPPCLAIEDSWTLLKRIAFPRKDAHDYKVSKEMEEMGKQMIKHCGGLPLAIKVLGGLLAAKYTLHDWKRVSEDIGSHIVGRINFNDDNNNSLVYRVLSLSFEELPSCLKHCFLYFSHFPEDYAIPIWKLSYYWAAEGILKPGFYDGVTIRDVTDSYIEDLVRRNMVISERDSITSRFETCHLHDMMREVSLSKAKEENFLQIAGKCFSTTDSQTIGNSRRIVLQNPTELLVERDIINPKLRSLLAMWDEEERKWILSGFSFTKLQLLRLLDLSGAKFEGRKFPSSVGKLIHLRYFSLEKAEVSHIPSSLRNLKLLIYLNLDVTFKDRLYMPNVLMEMQELRYLVLPRVMGRNTKLELSKLVKLEALKNFSTAECSVGDLHGMTRLRNLTILLTDNTSIETISASIAGLGYLKNLHITDECKSKRMIEERIVLDFIHLKVLVLRTYMPRIYSEQHFPSRLTCLDLRHCRLVEDPMPILEKLLQLNEVRLGYLSFCGRRMVCSSGGFLQLQKLYLRGLQAWEEWIIEEGSMPLIHTLFIRECEMLKELPYGLRFIKSLTNLTIGVEWMRRLSEGGEDYYKVQHIPSVIFPRY